MKLYEELAKENCDKLKIFPEFVLEEAYIMGFMKARELASDLVKERPNPDWLLYHDIRELGERVEFKEIK